MINMKVATIKTTCTECGYRHTIKGNLGSNWVAYVFRCDVCGNQVVIRKTAKEELDEFKKRLSDVNNVRDFLEL